MSIFLLLSQLIIVMLAVIKVLKRPLFTLDIVGGKTYFEWTSFWWFLLGLAAFINIVYSLS